MLTACSGDNNQPQTSTVSIESAVVSRDADNVSLVNRARILAAGNSEWLTHGRTYSEQRNSPLSIINRENVSDLGLAWSFELDTDRGQEATPLVIDGVVYLTTAWSKAFAVDARTG
ncbi:MAG TPA: PQQ-binding-like beta-propeller repeat protein, partial [Pseudohongiella sp.]|nr:PQQ-binding-like beta-propeller repeat protein [Pseudohongiella sp.]